MEQEIERILIEIAARVDPQFATEMRRIAEAAQQAGKSLDEIKAAMQQFAKQQNVPGLDDLLETSQAAALSLADIPKILDEVERRLVNVAGFSKDAAAAVTGIPRGIVAAADKLARTEDVIADIRAALSPGAFAPPGAAEGLRTLEEVLRELGVVAAATQQKLKPEALIPLPPAIAQGLREFLETVQQHKPVTEAMLKAYEEAKQVLADVSAEQAAQKALDELNRTGGVTPAIFSRLAGAAREAQAQLKGAVAQAATVPVAPNLLQSLQQALQGSGPQPLEQLRQVLARIRLEAAQTEFGAAAQALARLTASGQVTEEALSRLEKALRTLAQAQKEVEAPALTQKPTGVALPPEFAAMLQAAVQGEVPLANLQQALAKVRLELAQAEFAQAAQAMQRMAAAGVADEVALGRLEQTLRKLNVAQRETAKPPTIAVSPEFVADIRRAWQNAQRLQPHFAQIRLAIAETEFAQVAQRFEQVARAGQVTQAHLDELEKAARRLSQAQREMAQSSELAARELVRQATVTPDQPMLKLIESVAKGKLPITNMQEALVLLRNELGQQRATYIAQVALAEFAQKGEISASVLRSLSEAMGMAAAQSRRLGTVWEQLQNAMSDVRMGAVAQETRALTQTLLAMVPGLHFALNPAAALVRMFHDLLRTGGVLGPALHTVQSAVAGLARSIQRVGEIAAGFVLGNILLAPFNALTSTVRHVVGSIDQFVSRAVMLNQELGKTPQQLEEQRRVWDQFLLVLTKPTYDFVVGKLQQIARGLGLIGEQRDWRTAFHTFGATLGDELQRAAEYLWNWAADIVGGAGPLNPSNWLKAGANLAASFAEGLINGFMAAIPVITSLIQMIADFLIGHSPPPLGPLRDIIVGGRNLIQDWMRGMLSADFSILDRLTSLVASRLRLHREISEQTQAQQQLAARDVIAEALAQITLNGEIAAATLNHLRTLFGEMFGDVERYLGLVAEWRNAQAAVAAAQVAYNAAADRLRAVQEEARAALEAQDEIITRIRYKLENFELATAEIPAAFTAGRRRQLETELRAAERRREEVRKEYDLRIRVAQRELEAAQKSLELSRLQEQRIQQEMQLMERLLQEYEKRNELLARGTQAKVGLELPKIDEALKAQLTKALEPLREILRQRLAEPMAELQMFFKGLLGTLSREEREALVQEKLPRGLAEAARRGMELRDALESLWRGLETVPGKVRAIQTAVESLLNSIRVWWDGLPDPLRKFLIGAGIAHIATGGISTGIEAIAAWEGIKKLFGGIGAVLGKLRGAAPAAAEAATAAAEAVATAAPELAVAAKAGAESAVTQAAPLAAESGAATVGGILDAALGTLGVLVPITSGLLAGKVWTEAGRALQKLGIPELPAPPDPSRLLPHEERIYQAYVAKFQEIRERLRYLLEHEPPLPLFPGLDPEAAQKHAEWAELVRQTRQELDSLRQDIQAFARTRTEAPTDELYADMAQGARRAKIETTQELEALQSDAVGILADLTTDGLQETTALRLGVGQDFSHLNATVSQSMADLFVALFSDNGWMTFIEQGIEGLAVIMGETGVRIGEALQGWLNTFVGGLSNLTATFYQWLDTTFGANLDAWFNAIISKFFAFGASIGAAILSGLGGLGLGTLGIPQAQTGGYVVQSGLVYVHAGETILPVQRQAGIGHHITIQNYWPESIAWMDRGRFEHMAEQAAYRAMRRVLERQR